MGFSPRMALFSSGRRAAIASCNAHFPGPPLRFPFPITGSLKLEPSPRSFGNAAYREPSSRRRKRSGPAKDAPTALRKRASGDQAVAVISLADRDSGLIGRGEAVTRDFARMVDDLKRAMAHVAKAARSAI